MEPIIKPTPGEVKAEIQSGVPVKQPTSIPVTTPKTDQQFVAQQPIANTPSNSNSSEDAELEKIMTDVNHQINTSINSDADKTKEPGVLTRSASKIEKIKPAKKEKTPGSKPKFAIALAIIVVVGLAAAAAYSFKQTQDKQKITRAHQASVEHAKEQAAKTQAESQPTTFNADYLTNFDNSISSDQAQDFDSDPLSDNSLGI